MVDYEAGIKRPFQDIKKLLIGSILSIIPIVNFISTGYFVNAAKNTLNKKNDLPEWEDWGSLFITGLTVAVIGVIYSLPALVLLAIGAGSIIMSAISGGMMGFDILSALSGGSIFILVGLILMVLAMFVGPMAIMRYVDKGNFSDAFSIGEVFKKAFRGKYIVAWIILAVYGIVIMGASFIIPVVGTAIAGFILGITSMTIFAEVYSEE